MKKKNLKKVLAVLSAAALSAQLALPSVFAESETDVQTTDFAQSEREFKDDIIFIGGTDGDTSSVKSVAFGVTLHRSVRFGKPDGGFMQPKQQDSENSDDTSTEPPEKPDGDVTPPEKPDGETGDNVTPPERPDGETGNYGTPPEKPEGETGQSELPDGQPPEIPDGGMPGRDMRHQRFGTDGDMNANGENTGDDSMPEPPEKGEKTKLEIAEGDTLSITKSDGTVLYTGEADKAAKGVVFSSDELEEGETYTLLINGESAANVQVRDKAGKCEDTAGGTENAPRFDGKRPPMPSENEDDSEQQNN